ncbi:MAG: Dam family site-specific DNA-(adenine-N6)-methyltransferase, partial [Bacteroidetes bacterium]|nr:Dam family site-specific DNA-(adenine-N6)-methyltransferase [Bacteroidota bacterium]
MQDIIQNRENINDNFLVYNYAILGQQKIIKSPLNYIGGKYKLLPQILPLLPKNINCFVDLFAGGCNVGINISANKVVCNDNIPFLIDLYNKFKRTNILDIIAHIDKRIVQYDLNLENKNGYMLLRDNYNKQKNPLDLFVLISYSFNHQIRFNNKHEYNTPFGKDRSSFNETMRCNLILFVERIKNNNIDFNNIDYSLYDFSQLSINDFVYCDPPYLITTATYNDGKRGFKGWNENEEKKLLAILETLDSKGILFALSNVLEHKGRSNDLLKKWIIKNNYHVNYLSKNYSNSSYNIKNRDK